MKLEAVNSRMSMQPPSIKGFHPKDPFDNSGSIFGRQAAREYAQLPQAKWLHMQVGGSFERAT
uniref:Basic helix-loop-helix protein n=1 Tax=Rhizophora mucronata TaxID=61149 RepID=A0A2P2IZM1_RHIMU